MASDKKGPAARPSPTPELMRGVQAVRNAGSVFGPAAPSEEPGPRGRLAKLLNLSNPSDTQLIEDAANLIEQLQAERGK